MPSIVKNDYGQVQQIALSSDVPALLINHKHTQAKISLYGGQVLSWQPTNERDVFWLSQSTPFEQGKAIRGGIPLCWPWFGVHPDDTENTVGNHGFARCQLWTLDNIEISEQGVEIKLSWQGENMSHLWPYPCQLTQVLFFGESFSQTLTMTNLGNQDAYFSGALHSYFLVSSPENAVITDLAKTSFDDKLTGENFVPAKPSILPLSNGIDAVDKVYHSNEVMTIVDEFWQRKIRLETSNTQQWVFWNPGVELSNNMADIHEKGEQEFLCLEAANTQMQLLEAGKSLTMAQTITVTSHDHSK